MEIERAKCIDSAGFLDYANKFSNVVPNGHALLDQLAGQREKEYNLENKSQEVPQYLNGQFYSVRGDADVNNDGQADSEEGQVMLPYGSNRISASAMYQVIGRVDGVSSERSWVPNIQFGSSKLWSAKIRMDPNANGLMPNDLCTRYDSGLGPGATPLRGRPSFPWGPSSDPTKVRVPGDLIDPSNHTLLKNQATLDTIVKLLKEKFIP